MRTSIVDLLIDLDHPYSGSKQDLFPNPEPRGEFLNYKRRLEYRGINLAQLRPVEDILANFPKYEGFHVSLSLPVKSLQEIEHIGSYDGLSFTWSDRRFGAYLFVCPIASGERLVQGLGVEHSYQHGQLLPRNRQDYRSYSSQ